MARVSSKRIHIEVAYAEADRQIVIPLMLDKGSTVADAIAHSRIATRVPDISWQKVGIFSRIVRPETLVDDGDRVELYRALTVDPKEARRRRTRVKT